MDKTTRRNVVAGLAAMPLVAGFGGAAHALTPNEASALVKRMAADIETAINSGRSDSAMFKEFESLLSRYADMDTVARFSLGPAARTASSSELRSFTAAFKPYIARKYGVRFREFVGGKLDIKNARTDRSAVVVSGNALLRGQSPIAVEFHVSDRSGSAKVFNVVIEGINMLTTERTEITSLLDQQGGSVSKLTAELKRRS